MPAPFAATRTRARESRSTHPLDRPRGRPCAATRPSRDPGESETDLARRHRQCHFDPRTLTPTRQCAQHQTIGGGLRQVRHLASAHIPDRMRHRDATGPWQFALQTRHQRTPHGIASPGPRAPQFVTQREPRPGCTATPLDPQTLPGSHGTRARGRITSGSVLLFESARDDVMVSQVPGHFKRSTRRRSPTGPSPQRRESAALHPARSGLQRESQRLRRAGARGFGERRPGAHPTAHAQRRLDRAQVLRQ